MDAEGRVVSSLESLEAQVEIVREFVRLRRWENVDLVVQNITRTASCLAEAALTAKLELPGTRCLSANSGKP